MTRHTEGVSRRNTGLSAPISTHPEVPAAPVLIRLLDGLRARNIIRGG